MFFKRGGDLYMRRTFSKGASSETKFVEQASRLGRKFLPENPEDRRFGEHYIVAKDGSLQIRDDEGLILTAPPISK